MGSGEIGSNGSVHSIIRHNDTPGAPVEYHSRDPIPYDRIGQGTGGSAKGHPAAFAVRMRFETAADASAALDAAKATITALPNAGGVYATCYVPRVGPMRPDENTNPYLEVKVDW